MPFTATFHGFIENTTDTLLIIEACRSGLLPTVRRRLFDSERNVIKSGTIIVFNETETGIKRWTDGLLWSPSRILGNFLVYRELVNREQRKSLAPPNGLAIDQRERALIGSLTASNTPYNFKENGLIKKTIRMLVNGNFLHIVSYYNKDDVLNHVLPTPSTSPLFNNIRISPDLMPHLQGYSNHSLLLSASVIQAKTRVQNDELCLRKRSISSSSSSDNNNDSSHSSHSNHRKRISLPRPFDLPLIDLQQTDMLYSSITKCHQNSILHPYYT